MLDKEEEALNVEDGQEAEQSPFYIASAGAPSRPRCILKQNDCFVVLDDHGAMGCASDEAGGLFARDTRHLSRLAFLINGQEPLLLGSTVRDDNLNLRADLTNPDVHDGDGIVLLKDTVHIGRTMYIHNGVLCQRSAVENHGNDPVTLTVTIDFESDFADLFEVRGMRRPARGSLTKEVVGRNKVVLRYTGLDRKVRETALTFEPEPTELTPTCATYALTLAPSVRWHQFVSVSCDGEGRPAAPSFLRGLLQARRDLVGKPHAIATIETSNTVFNEIACRSLSDLRMLTTATPQGKYPYAGIPWYSTTFGRDGLITAMQMLWFDPSVARGVLQRLAHFQAAAFDDASDAQPGKILHEMRSGEMAGLGEVPFGLYYGSIDSTPLFILLAGLYVERTGRHRLPAPNLAQRRARARMDPRVGRSRRRRLRRICARHPERACEPGVEGFPRRDFPRRTAILPKDRSRCRSAGLRLCGVSCRGELRTHAWRARPGRRAHREGRNASAAVRGGFWCEDLGTYALALDGRKQPCRVRTSNAAHAMFTGIMAPERAQEWLGT